MSDSNSNKSLSSGSDHELDSLAARARDRIPESTRITDSLSAHFQGRGPLGATHKMSDANESQTPAPAGEAGHSSISAGEWPRTGKAVPIVHPGDRDQAPDPVAVERIMRSFAGGRVYEPDPYIPPTPEEMIREGLRLLGYIPGENDFSVGFLQREKTPYVAISLEKNDLVVQSASGIVLASNPKLPGHGEEW